MCGCLLLVERPLGAVLCIELTLTGILAERAATYVGVSSSEKEKHATDLAGWLAG